MLCTCMYSLGCLLKRGCKNHFICFTRVGHCKFGIIYCACQECDLLMALCSADATTKTRLSSGAKKRRWRRRARARCSWLPHLSSPTRLDSQSWYRVRYAYLSSLPLPHHLNISSLVLLLVDRSLHVTQPSSYISAAF